jgi:hypothetical protein
MKTYCTIPYTRLRVKLKKPLPKSIVAVHNARPATVSQRTGARKETNALGC